MENVDAEEYISRSWISKFQPKRVDYYELKRKLWFDEGCSELLDERKQA
jgi:hypothetical protein